MGCELCITVLRRKRIGPVAREPIMAVAVVRLTNLAGGRAAFVQNGLGGRINGLSQNTGLAVVFCFSQEGQAFA